ncbi:hypothetical protein [Sphingobacterium sp.]|uniref:hypothetical protein n=1 Tax=Sphingobacterium sp. TaxID=341027 RepID=UPI0031D1A9AB
MKKSNKPIPKLNFQVKKIVVLNSEAQSQVNAGEDASIFTRPSSYACPAPYNQPPFLTMKDCI